METPFLPKRSRKRSHRHAAKDTSHLAQFEWEIIRDRTVAGLAAARARGRVGGRPSKLTAEQVRQGRRMYDARELTVEQIGAVLA